MPYNGGPAAALADVAGGRVSMIIEGYSGIVGSVKAGQVKLIAVASPERLPQFPDLPTVAETIPGFAARGWQVLVAPLGTPAPIVSKISADLAKVVSDPDFKQRLEQYRQLFARHDARAGSRFRAEGAGHLAAGAAEDFAEVKRISFEHDLIGTFHHRISGDRLFRIML